MEQSSSNERWEHCSYFNNVLTFFRTTGTVVVPIKRDKDRGDRNDTDAYNRIIAQLGFDGWQYVGMNGLSSWFKRRIS